MSNIQEITNPRQELLNVLANLPNIALGADKYTCDASLGEEGNEEGDIVISYHIDALSSGKTIKAFLKSVEGLKIPNLTIDEKKLQINVKSFDVVLSAVYVYLNKNPDKISKDNVEYLEGLYGDICSSMYPSNVEILGDNLYEGFSHPRTLNLLTNAFELVGNYETQLSLNPEEGEKNEYGSSLSVYYVRTC